MTERIELTGGWDTLFDEPARTALTRDALPSWLRRQRWFGGKARPFAGLRLVDHAPLCDDPAVFFVLAEVSYADGGADLLALPLAVLPPDRAPRHHAIAHLSGPAGTTTLCDAVADPALCQLYLQAVAAPRVYPTGHSTLRTLATARFRDVCGDDPAALPAVLSPATSSNSLVYFGDRFLMKVFRRLEAGLNPDFEIGRFLTESGRFAPTPVMAGAVEYHREGAEPITLAVVQQLVANENDGWRMMLAVLADYFAEAAASPGPPTQRAGLSLPRVELLAACTARMHRALASDPNDPAFAPEPLTSADVETMTREVGRQAEAALALLRDNLDRLPADVRADAEQLQARTPALLAALSQAATPSATKQRCHGDYHLGQVLWTGRDFVVLDFEGEPTRPIAERRQKQSPLKDVAGMLRSLDYAAAAGLFAASEGDPHKAEKLRPWADLWRRQTAEAFLREYRFVAGDAAFLPAQEVDFDALLTPALLAKAFYELSYELNNRPDWVRIPLNGLLALAGAGHKTTPTDLPPGPRQE